MDVSPQSPAEHPDLAALIRRETAILAPPLTPELRHRGAADYARIWGATEDSLAALNLPPPFWAFAWAGGQALARYILDHPDAVRGRRVLALAAGAGIEAIAAVKSGASSVLANDIDPVARVAMALNADLNQVALSIDGADYLAAQALPAADLILAGDIFYEQAIAAKLRPLLARAAAAGAEVWIGDAGRPYRPAPDRPEDRVTPLARYTVPTPVDLEDAPSREATVLRMTA